MDSKCVLPNSWVSPGSQVLQGSPLVTRYYDAEKNILETYRLDINVDIDDIKKNIKETKILTSNDRHIAVAVEGNVMVQLNGILFKVVNPDICDENEKEFVLKNETYEEYLIKINSLKDSNYRWIYNIIEGKSEVDKILYSNDDFILIPDYGFVHPKSSIDKFDISKLHILAIVRDKTIMTIRDIKPEHIPMLESLKIKSIECIESLYNIKANKLKIFYHYYPSTYLLHVHFTHISKCDIKTSFDRCHDFDQVIKNIKLDPSYYRGDMKVGDFVTII